MEKTGKGEEKARTINRERFISTMFFRGDSVIVILRNQRLARCFFCMELLYMKNKEKKERKTSRFSMF